MPNRDDFSKPVKEALAKRVGCRCSNPSCRKLTSGPHKDPKKSVNIGVAAHITAAAPEGPRYTDNLSSEERSAIENGIWLCQNCGKLIDSDEQKYPVALLLEWKRDAEQRASSEVENGTPQISSHMPSARFEQYLQNLVNTPQSWWLDEINESTWYEFELFTKVEEKSEQSGEKPQEIPKRILEVLQNCNDQKILISGSPGTGKSTLLEKLAVKAASKAQIDANAPIPVLIKLKNYEASGERPRIRELIQASLERGGLSLGDEAIKQLPAHRFLLLMDGWNELSDEKAKSTIKDSCKPYSIIVTSRNARDWWNVQHKKFEIQPLSRQDVTCFFNERLPNTELQQLQKLIDRVKDFGQTPLMVWMLYSVFQATGSTPETRGEAYYTFTKLYSERAKQGLDLTGVTSTLGQLAFSMMQSRKPGDPTDFTLEIAENNAKRLLDTKEDQLKKIQNHLLRWEGERNPKISFCHQSLQEYYAAEYLLDRLTEHPEWLDRQGGQEYTDFQQEYLNYEKWTEPIALLLGLCEENIAISIIKQALDVDLMLGARLAGATFPIFHKQIIQMIKDCELPVEIEIKLLGITGSKQIVDYLKDKIIDEDPHLRWLAIDALSWVKNQVSTDLLIKALQDSDLRVRCKVLGELGKTDSMPALVAITGILQEPSSIDDELPDIHLCVVKALEESRSKYAVNALLEIVVEPNYSSRVRSKAIHALMKSGVEIPQHIVLALLEDDDFVVKYAMASRIRHMKNFSELEKEMKIKNLEDELMLETVEEYISSIDDALSNVVDQFRYGDRSVLINHLSSENWEVCCLAATALGDLKETTAVTSLEAVLHDENRSPAWSNAANALSKIATPSAISALMKCLLTEDETLRLCIIDALGDLGNLINAEVLAQILQDDEDVIIRHRAVIALGKIGGNISRKALWGAVVYDKSPIVQSTAAKLLGENFSSENLSLIWYSAHKWVDPIFLELIQMIQQRCKFYNYEIHQTAQTRSSQANQQAPPGSTINNFPNATEVKIFEQIDGYHTTPTKDLPS